MTNTEKSSWVVSTHSDAVIQLLTAEGQTVLIAEELNKKTRLNPADKIYLAGLLPEHVPEIDARDAVVLKPAPADVPAAEYLQRSVLGQVALELVSCPCADVISPLRALDNGAMLAARHCGECGYREIEIPDGALYAAAECGIRRAYRAEFPGIDPSQLLWFRAKTDTALNPLGNIGVAERVREIKKFAEWIRKTEPSAEILDLDKHRADMPGKKFDVILGEAALYAGRPVTWRTAGTPGRVKVDIAGAPPQILARFSRQYPKSIINLYTGDGIAYVPTK